MPISNASIIDFIISIDPSRPSEVTTSKLSALVWYSGYIPYLVRQKPQRGKSIPGAQYCLSSDPLSRKEYFLTLSNPINAASSALSAKLSPNLDSIWLYARLSPTQERLNPQITLSFNSKKFLLKYEIEPIVSTTKTNLYVYLGFSYLDFIYSIKAVESTETDFDKLIVDSNKRLTETEVKVDKFRKDISKIDIVKYVVSEEGVKSFIVHKLLELLNSKLLTYLRKLDSNSICIFNEYFEEEITNEKNKICSYFNFSGAERKSIDLACLFTFSDMRRMQGGVKYNLAIYDELFDSSFDEKGIELVTQILQERTEELDECSIVISHRKESIKAVTGEVVYIEKENGISRRVAYTEL